MEKGTVVVVELVAMVEPGTTSGRSFDAHAPAPTTTNTATTTTRAALIMARDPIDPIAGWGGGRGVWSGG